MRLPCASGVPRLNARRTRSSDTIFVMPKTSVPTRGRISDL